MTIISNNSRDTNSTFITIIVFLMASPHVRAESFLTAASYTSQPAPSFTQSNQSYGQISRQMISITSKFTLTSRNSPWLPPREKSKPLPSGERWRGWPRQRQLSYFIFSLPSLNSFVVLVYRHKPALCLTSPWSISRKKSSDPCK